MAADSNDTQWLYNILVQVQLEQFYTKIRDDVQVTKREHLDYLLSSDLENIGIGKREAQRLLEMLKKNKTVAYPKSRINKDFQRGDLVWGKIPGWSYWPAMILNPTDVNRTSTSPNKHWLFWFGEHTLSEVPKRNICSLRYNFKQNANKSMRCKEQFDEAVEEALAVVIKANNINLGNIPVKEWALEGFESNCLIYFQWIKEELPAFIQVALSANENKEEGTVQVDEVKKVVTEVLSNEKSLDDICIACCRENILVQQHPLLEGKVCEKCTKDVNRINKLSPGRSHRYCIVCGQGGNLSYCIRKSCRRAFCEECIGYLDSKGAFAKISSIDYWLCYVCKPVKRKTCLIKKRAYTKDSKKSPKKSPKVPLDTNKTECAFVKSVNQKDFVIDSASNDVEAMECSPNIPLITPEYAHVKNASQANFISGTVSKDDEAMNYSPKNTAVCAHVKNESQMDFVCDTASKDETIDCSSNIPSDIEGDIDVDDDDTGYDDDVDDDTDYDYSEVERIIRKVINKELSLDEICISCCSMDAKLVMPHPLFIGQICNKCKKAVVKAVKLDTGIMHKVCIICGQGGNLLYCCRKACQRAYCYECIKYMELGRSFLELTAIIPWFCYLCEPVDSSTCLIIKRKITKSPASNKKSILDSMCIKDKK